MGSTNLFCPALAAFWLYKHSPVTVCTGVCLAHANKLNTGYSPQCLSRTRLIYRNNKKPTGKRAELYLVYIVALFDWLTPISVFFKDKSVSLCNNCAHATKMKDEFIGRSLQKGRKIRACMGDTFKRAQIWFHSAFTPFADLNKSKSKQTPVTTLVLLQKYHFSVT